MRLITGINFRDVPDIPLVRVFFRILLGRKPQHLGVGDVPFCAFEQPFLVKSAFLKGFFDDVVPLRFAVNGKIFLDSRFGGIHAQNAHAHAVNGAHPHIPYVRDFADPLLHLVRRLIRERDGQYGFGGNVQIFHQMRDARRQHPRLAASRARQHQYRPFRRENGLYLFVVETVQ